MSLGYDVAQALPGLRAQAEAMMVDRCRVERVTPGTVLNETTGEYTPTRVRVYPPASAAASDGICRYKAANTAVRDVEAAGQLLIEQAATLSLPISASLEVAEGDIVTFTASTFDPQMVGVEVRIAGEHHQTFATARRFPVEEIS